MVSAAATYLTCRPARFPIIPACECRVKGRHRTCFVAIPGLQQHRSRNRGPECRFSLSRHSRGSFWKVVRRRQSIPAQSSPTKRVNSRPTLLSSPPSADRSPATQESRSQRHRCLGRNRESPRPRKGASIVLSHSGDLAPSLLGAFLQRYCELLSPACLPPAATQFRSILLRGSKRRRGKSHFPREVA